MKRSEINAALKEPEAVREKYHCYLPPLLSLHPGRVADQGPRI